ncbi:MAG: protein-S-isoprenylcysteine O-methyltransferase Ste14 [Zhongshania sp.]|jgi:protein-S-isoprenylcysteine O-methyltransferase Ste14
MVCVAGVLSFRRAGTTVNPLKPEFATSLVIVGIYGYSRNPMYLGFLCGLLAWVLVLGSLLAL